MPAQAAIPEIDADVLFAFVLIAEDVPMMPEGVLNLNNSLLMFFASTHFR